MKSLLPLSLFLALVGAVVYLIVSGGASKPPAGGGALLDGRSAETPDRAPVDLNLPPELSGSGQVFDAFYGERAEAARAQAEALGFVPEEAGLKPFDPAWNQWFAEQIPGLYPGGIPGDACNWPGFDGVKTLDQLGQPGQDDFPARARARPGWWLLELELDDERLKQVDVEVFERNVKLLEDVQVLNDLCRAALRTAVAAGRGLWVPGPPEIAWALRWPDSSDPSSPWVFTSAHQGWTYVVRFEGESADEIQQYRRLIERNTGRCIEYARAIAKGETPSFRRGR